MKGQGDAIAWIVSWIAITLTSYGMTYQWLYGDRDRVILALSIMIPISLAVGLPIWRQVRRQQ